MTITELLELWKGRHAALKVMAGRDYGEDSPERNKMTIIMANQLAHCITELEELMNETPARRAMSKIVAARLESDKDAQSR